MRNLRVLGNLVSDYAKKMLSILKFKKKTNNLKVKVPKMVLN